MPHPQHSSNSEQSQPSRRSDAGKIRLQPRDVNGLLTLAEMYAAPYDLLAARLGVSDDRLRGVIARWRDAGLASTGKLAAGPHWCWLTPAGMRQTGHPWEAAPPPLSRLAHVRAVLAARLWLEESAIWAAGQARWRPERQLLEGRPGVGRAGHVADAEVSWPSVPGSRLAGELWAVEVELTPKAADRVQRIMGGLLAGQYASTLYVCGPAALNVVRKAAGAFAPEQSSRVRIVELPPYGLMPGAA